MSDEWASKYGEGICSDEFAWNIISAYLAGTQSLKWCAGKLEQWSTCEEHHARREEKLKEIIERFGGPKKDELFGEMRRRRVFV